ncbi:DUF4298 domain-containing protein [Streptococcus pneumoniae]
MKKELEMIQQMEEIAHRASQVFESLERSLELFEELEPDFKQLVAYYDRDWMRHYEMENRGEFPCNVSRGVLGQDTIYNLMVVRRELLSEMARLSEKER